VDNDFNLEELNLKVPTEDIDELLKEISDSPSLYITYALQLEEIKNQKNDLLIKIKVAEALIANNLRAENPRISEAKIDRSLWSQKEFVVLQTELNTLKLQEGKLHAIVRGIDQRHSLLISSVHLIRGELRKLQ
jgi:hypothetical protein